MEIQLNLKYHCIQTACKKLYNSSISQYFKPDADIYELESRIAILRSALETFDFSNLRKNYPELNGKSDHLVLLFYDDDGNIGIKIDHHSILSRPCKIELEHLHS